MLRIAIQGIEGSFHHLALFNIYKDLYNKEKYSICECNSFIELTKVICNNKVDLGIMAIENSIVGDIISNYILLFRNKLKILSEVLIPISHQLMGLYNQKLSDIKKVISHPMAISQCEKFFKINSQIKLFDYYDTAGAAKYISYNKVKGVAAIAPKISADIYGLNIINPNINMNKKNFTRFFIIKNFFNHTTENDFNKSSLIIELYNNEFLYQLINILYNYKIIILKIQSLPSGNKKWNYIFLFELLFDNIDKYLHVKKIFLKIVKNLYVIGEYKNMQKH